MTDINLFVDKYLDLINKFSEIIFSKYSNLYEIYNDSKDLSGDFILKIRNTLIDKIYSFETDTEKEKYLYKSILNFSIDEIRKKKRKKYNSYNDDISYENNTFKDISNTLNDSLQVLFEIYDKLPPKYKKPFKSNSEPVFVSFDEKIIMITVKSLIMLKYKGYSISKIYDLIVTNKPVHVNSIYKYYKKGILRMKSLLSDENKVKIFVNLKEMIV
ncbi:MAG: hypothetical protein LBV58_02290 [Acholeplasmatales bacterium]|jgi:hypothetical protein|nr:hypothetical protein [Acholeplasmatales bacterium]